MEDFKSWEEVEQWLMEEDEYNGVLIKSTWYFSKGYMNCGSECCSDSFEDIEECMATIRSYADDRLDNVERGDW